MNVKTVLIADDDALARIGIRSIIPFSEFGFEIVGEADNGQKALEMAEAMKPDLILTDILMPGLNGIELIRECRKKNLPSKFIVLSSHEDFKYVKEALKEGAEDYILKIDLEKDSFIQTLRKAAEKHEAAQETGSRTEAVSGFRKNADRDAKEILYSGTLLGEKQAAEAERLFRLPPCPFFCLTVKMISADGHTLSEQDIQRLEIPAQNVLEEITRHYDGSVCLYLGGRSFFVLAPLHVRHINTSELRKYAHRLTENIRQMFTYVLNISAVAGVSKIHPSARSLPKAFAESQEAAKQAIISGKNTFFCYDIGADAEKQEETVSVENDIAELTDALGSFNMEQVEAVCSRILEKISNEKQFSANRLQGVCYMLYLTVNSFAQSVNVDPGLIWNPGNEKNSGEEQILLLSDREEYLIWCRNLYKNIRALLSPADKKIKIIIDAKTYISRHYAENITLESVSAETGISPTYFSKLFSKVAGTKFIDFVTQVRIAHAKELLRNSQYKIFAVAEMTGYDNTTYFSYLFKKETGMTPQEYRIKNFIPDEQ